MGMTEHTSPSNLQSTTYRHFLIVDWMAAHPQAGSSGAAGSDTLVLVLAIDFYVYIEIDDNESRYI